MVEAITAAGGQAIAIRADSADAEALQLAIRQTVNSFGKLDILVNNAGVLAMGSLEELSLADLIARWPLTSAAYLSPARKPRAI